jgi:chromosomal replication initiator protein
VETSVGWEFKGGEINLEEARQAWRSAIRTIADSQEGSLDLWLGQVDCVGFEGERLLLRVPNEFTREWISERYLDDILERMQRTVPGVTSVTFQLDRSAFARPSEDQDRSTPVPSASSPPRLASPPPMGASVNPRFTFDQFVEGPCNRLALAACLALVQSTETAVSPLFLYGPSGVGKTHLLNAIHHALRGATRHGPVVYMPSESFMNDFLESLRGGRMKQFRERYRRDCGLLLIDDIQFIASRERTQEEFFHLFNELYNTGRPIVISSDRPPREMSRVESRLRSRFECGLMADMRAPELETRLAIVHKKAAGLGLRLPPEVAELVAAAASHSVREIEGALIRLDVQSSLEGCAVTAEMARRALGGLAVENADRITPSQVLKCVAVSYGIKVSDLKGTRRSRSVSLPRQVAMHLCREVLGMSYPEIGDLLGGRDHSTIINGCRKVTALLDADASLQGRVASIRQELGVADAA